MQALNAGSVAALPEGVRLELESIEDAGGVRFLQEMANQIKVRRPGQRLDTPVLSYGCQQRSL